MAYLLDTVALVRWWGGGAPVGPAARALLEGDELIHVSAVSVWEIANKIRIGKMTELPEFAQRFPAMVRDSGFAHLSMSAEHAMRAGFLPGAHRDPFDRLIAGQALVGDMTVVTNDPEIAAFGCEVLW